MAMPAIRFRENVMEERIARLEVNVEHIQSDITEMKGDIRRLDTKIDAVKTSLDAKIDAVAGSLNTKIDTVAESLNAKIDAVRDSLASAKIWALGLYVALAGALFAALARGFGWM